LIKRYGEKVALGGAEGVSFHVPQGQVCGYLGPNGAGKSTTIRLLAGLDRPDAGRILIGGHDLSLAPLEAKRLIGYVPEASALYSLLSPREHLALVCDLYELEEELARERIASLTDLFDLEELGDRRVDTLSKGQRQKVTLALALVHDPQIVLMDEPLTGLDVNAARSLRDVIAGLAERGRTVLYCSHILDVVERVCSRTIILDEGQVVADAPTAELISGSREATLEAVFHQLTRAADAGDHAQAFLEGVDGKKGKQGKQGKKGKKGKQGR
jgi:ABC-2 type transport system ATP-binding protein